MLNPRSRLPSIITFAAVVLLMAVSFAGAGADGPAAPPGAPVTKPAKPATKPATMPDPLAPVADEPGLPRVLILGDSISIGYTIPVREMLKGKANVHRPPDNCEDTAHGLRKLDDWIGAGHWDAIHFNFGLHDMKYLDETGKYVEPAKGKQVATPEDYEKNLRALVDRLKKTGAKLVWASTTPVPGGSMGRVQGDEIKYNEVAKKVMEENGVQIDDLWAAAEKDLAKIQRPHNVHYTDEGYKELAQSVADSVQAALAK